jgi:O-antigen ligase
MPSNIDDAVFREPVGGLFAGIQFCGALLLIGLYAYSTIWTTSTVGSGGVFVGVGMGLSGLAECLPNSRRRTAGVLRPTAILVLLGVLATISFAPEVFTS